MHIRNVVIADIVWSVSDWQVKKMPWKLLFALICDNLFFIKNLISTYFVNLALLLRYLEITCFIFCNICSAKRLSEVSPRLKKWSNFHSKFRFLLKVTLNERYLIVGWFYKACITGLYSIGSEASFCSPKNISSNEWKLKA